MNETVTVPFGKTHSDSLLIINTLSEKGCELGEGILACALAIARMYTVDNHLTDEEEIEFIQDLTDWVSAYFIEGEA